MSHARGGLQGVCRALPKTLYCLPCIVRVTALQLLDSQFGGRTAKRFLGAFVASQFTGMIFTIFIAASMGVVLAFLLEDWPGSSALKSVRQLVSQHACIPKRIHGKPVRYYMHMHMHRIGATFTSRWSTRSCAYCSSRRSCCVLSSRPCFTTSSAGLSF